MTLISLDRSGRLTLRASQEDDVVETRTCLDFFKSYWDPTQPCYVRFHTIDCEKLAVEDGFMLPKYVDVRLEPMASHCFWRGSAVEFAPRIAKHRKRKPSDSGDKPKLARQVVPKTGPGTGDRVHGQSGDCGPSDAGDECQDIDMVGPDPFDPDDGEPDTDFEDVIKDLCGESDQDQESDSETAQDDENDGNGGIEEPLSDLIAQFFASVEDEGDDLLGDDNEEAEPAIPPEGELLPPVHPAEQTSSSNVAPAAAPSSPGPRSSSSSSSSTSTSSAPVPATTRQVPTLQEAGAQSASAAHPSTVQIGPIKIVKRFHPAPGLNDLSRF